MIMLDTKSPTSEGKQARKNYSPRTHLADVSVWPRPSHISVPFLLARSLSAGYAFLMIRHVHQHAPKITEILRELHLATSSHPEVLPDYFSGIRLA